LLLPVPIAPVSPITTGLFHCPRIKLELLNV